MVSTKVTIIAILLAVATTEVVTLRKIPEFIHICDMKIEDYVGCVKESINKLIPVIRNGLPEYNIPRLEPIILNKLLFNASRTLLIEGKNMFIYGSSNFSITNLRLDIPKMLILLDVALPHLTVEGDYNLDGQILIIPVKGSGTFHSNVTDSIGSCKIQCQLYNDTNGVRKIRISNFQMKVTVNKGNIILDNLFNGDKTLGDIINTTINSNFQYFLNEIIPNLGKALSNMFNVMANNIVDQFAFDELFPHYSEVLLLTEGITK